MVIWIALLLTILKSLAPWAITFCGIVKACDVALTLLVQRDNFCNRPFATFRADHGISVADKFGQQIYEINRKHIRRGAIWSAVLLTVGVLWLVLGP